MMQPSVSALRALPAWAAGCLVAAAVAVTWWVLSFFHHHGPFYILGPFHVPVPVEVSLGVTALGAAGLVLARRPRPRAGPGLSRATVAVLVVTAVLTTAGWRAVTSPGEGADIGGGFLVLFGPVPLAGLLAWAVCLERTARRGEWRLFPLWLALAIAVAPILLTIVLTMN